MKSKKTVAVIDGANIAFIEKSAKEQPKVSNLVAVRQAVINRGLTPIIIVDASLRHEIDDPHQLESLIDHQTIRQAPADTDADYFVLTVAEQQNGWVISNDMFTPYESQFPHIHERRVPVMIVRGEVAFDDHAFESTGG